MKEMLFHPHLGCLYLSTQQDGRVFVLLGAGRIEAGRSILPGPDEEQGTIIGELPEELYEDAIRVLGAITYAGESGPTESGSGRTA